MSWDASMGRPRRRRVAFNPFEKLDSEWKAREAAGTAAVAAGLITFTHVISALVRFYGERYPALIGSSPVVLGLYNAMLALIAALAGYVAYRRHPLWLAWVILGWSVLEALPWVTARLYGHAANGKLVGLALVCAVIGLRGAKALRKGFPQETETAA